jgi:fructose-1,6-bisphosphatase/inositol monophosphatase family enzyme
MKTRIIATAAVAGIIAALAAGDVFAAGRGKGGANGQRSGTCTSAQNVSGASTTIRPAGSQRRDGTFLTTGTTANGSTTRPGNGNGLQDGSRLNTTAITPLTTVQ